MPRTALASRHTRLTRGGPVMTIAVANRAIRLRRRPEGPVRDGDLELVEEPVPELADGQALVRVLVVSVEAASRIWMGHQRAFMPPVPIDAVMRSIGVGEVVASRRADMRV